MSMIKTWAISSWISFLLSVDISVLPGTTQMNDLTQLPTVESKAGNDSNHMTHLLAAFRSAARLGRSAVGGTIFAQLGELAAGAVGFCRLLSQLGVVVLCLLFFPSLSCCLRGTIQTSESSGIDFECRLELTLRFFRPIQLQQQIAQLFASWDKRAGRDRMFAENVLRVRRAVQEINGLVFLTLAVHNPGQCCLDLQVEVPLEIIKSRIRRRVAQLLHPIDR